MAHFDLIRIRFATRVSEWWSGSGAELEMASRHQRRKRAAVKKAQIEADNALRFEQNEQAKRARAALALTAEQKDAARIERKVNAAFRNKFDGSGRHKGKGSGSYLGGHTVIGPHTPGWFGWKKD